MLIRRADVGSEVSSVVNAATRNSIGPDRFSKIGQNVS